MRFKNFYIIIFLIYAFGIGFSFAVFMNMSVDERFDINNILINSLELSKHVKDNNIMLYSIVSLVIILLFAAISLINYYLQAINIVLMFVKGFSFGITSILFFSIYKLNGLWFYFTYIFLKEIVLLSILVTINTYSYLKFSNYNRISKRQLFNLKAGTIAVTVLFCLISLSVDKFLSVVALKLLKSI